MIDDSASHTTVALESKTAFSLFLFLFMYFKGVNGKRPNYLQDYSFPELVSGAFRNKLEVSILHKSRAI